MINRGAVLIRPGQPYISWAAGLDDSGIVPTTDGEHTIYLIPEYDNDFHAMEILSQGYDIIFEMELEGWHLDETKWPKNRTFAMFQEWFVIEFHSVIEDLCDYPVLNDEYD